MAFVDSSDLSLLEVSDLKLALNPGSFTTRSLPILNDLSFKLDRGASLAVLGRTGSGKSLLLRAITKFFLGISVREIRGKVVFEGDNLLKRTQWRLRELRGSQIAYLLQDAHSLFNPQLSIRQHFKLLMRFKNPDVADPLEHVIQYLYRVGIVDPEAILERGCFPEQLDTATRQKIMIASALVGEPKLLLADEPTSEFDSGTVAHILTLFDKLKHERGMSMIVTTGRVRRAEQFGDEIAILEDGTIVERGEPKELFEYGRHESTRAFIDGTLLAGHPRERLVSHYYH